MSWTSGSFCFCLMTWMIASVWLQTGIYKSATGVVYEGQFKMPVSILDWFGFLFFWNYCILLLSFEYLLMFSRPGMTRWMAMGSSAQELLISSGSPVSTKVKAVLRWAVFFCTECKSRCPRRKAKKKWLKGFPEVDRGSPRNANFWFGQLPVSHTTSSPLDPQAVLLALKNQLFNKVI